MSQPYIWTTECWCKGSKYHLYCLMFYKIGMGYILPRRQIHLHLIKAPFLLNTHLFKTWITQCCLSNQCWIAYLFIPRRDLNPTNETYEDACPYSTHTPYLALCSCPLQFVAYVVILISFSLSSLFFLSLFLVS